MLGLWRVKRRAPLLQGIPGTVTNACGFSQRSGHPQPPGSLGLALLRLQQEGLKAGEGREAKGGVVAGVFSWHI